MKEKVKSADVFGFIKPLVDVHTMGVFTIANLLMDCGYKVYIAKDDVNEAVQDLRKLNNYGLLKQWITEKHITRLGMGPCRGKRCIPRARQALRSHGIELVGDATPRAPLSNPVTLGDLYNAHSKEVFVFPKKNEVRREQVEVLIAGGGIAGSALFRYFAEAGKHPVMINYSRGASWRCIGGGRPAFSNPDIADIAVHNHEIFKDMQQKYNINYHLTHYVNLVHDEATYKSLDASRAWSDAYMIERKDFKREISPLWDDSKDTYSHALITRDCWQATPGRVIDYIRGLGVENGGRYFEDCELLHVQKVGDRYVALVRNHEGHYIEYTCDHFVNAMGWGAEKFIDQLDLDTGLYPVKHQAFITRRLPMMGPAGKPLDMIIDRRHYKGFSAVYGQQWGHTGQIIGCASPDTDAYEARQNIKYNSKEFLEVVSEVFAEWIPNLREVGFLAVPDATQSRAISSTPRSDCAPVCEATASCWDSILPSFMSTSIWAARCLRIWKTSRLAEKDSPRTPLNSFLKFIRG